MDCSSNGIKLLVDKEKQNSQSSFIQPNKFLSNKFPSVANKTYVF